MKIRLSMSGRNSKGHVRFKQTITEQEFVEVWELISRRDGLRPWEQRKPEPNVRSLKAVGE